MSIPRQDRVDESDAVHRELVRVYVAVDGRRERVALECPAAVCSLARLLAELLDNALSVLCLERLSASTYAPKYAMAV